jgi:hypothetical protein
MHVIIRMFGLVVSMIAHSHPPLAAARSRALVGGLVLAILVGIAACAPSDLAPSTTPSSSASGASSPTISEPEPPTPHVSPPTATPLPNTLSKIHHATPDYIPLFAGITFTPTTTYEQAITILGRPLYPWTCDEPRTSTPPPLAEQQTAFAASHTLLISYPTWGQLTQIAASPQVVSVDGTPLYPCP